MRQHLTRNTWALWIFLGAILGGTIGACSADDGTPSGGSSFDGEQAKLSDGGSGGIQGDSTQGDSEAPLDASSPHDAAGAPDAGSTGDAKSISDVGASGDVGVQADTQSASNPPTPQPYTLGSCPVFAAGHNEIKAGGALRTFELFLPAKPKGAPIIFLWHGLGDFATNFAKGMGAAQIAQQRGAIMVVPQAMAPKSGATAMWQFPSPLSAKPPAFDLLLFDSLVTCLDGQYDFDNRRLTTMGFSAGALWSTYLVLHRSEWLAAAAIFSGGTSETIVPFSPPTREVPVIGSHGGPKDIFQGIIKFMEMMIALADKLHTPDNTFILCNHGQGHTVVGSVLMPAYDFLLAHTWGMKKSPYDATLVKKSFPSFCELK